MRSEIKIWLYAAVGKHNFPLRTAVVITRVFMCLLCVCVCTFKSRKHDCAAKEMRAGKG